MQKKTFWDYLLYGGLTKEEYHRVRNDIFESNRRNVVVFSAFAVLLFASLLAAGFISGIETITENLFPYLVGGIAFLFLLVLNLTLAKKHPLLFSFSALAFIVFTLFFGIYMAVGTGEHQQPATTFMIMLFATPLLFTIRPIFFIAGITISDLTYIILILQYEEGSVLHTNLGNALVYGAISLAACTYMSLVRIKSFYTQHVNNFLLEKDPMTGISNRRSFENKLEELKSGNTPCTAIVMDANGLKQMNDTKGHRAGDELIRKAASAIDTVFSPYGSCYRTGGDEFVVFLTDPAISAEELRERFITYLAENEVPVTLSIGIAEPADGMTIEEQLTKADKRMYRNKAEYYARIGTDRRSGANQ